MIPQIKHLPYDYEGILEILLKHVDGAQAGVIMNDISPQYHRSISSYLRQVDVTYNLHTSKDASLLVPLTKVFGVRELRSYLKENHTHFEQLGFDCAELQQTIGV